MAIWDQDKYLKAWNYASVAHHGQSVTRSSEIAYINHIGLVAMEAIAQDQSIGNPDLLLVCALLHDTIEDTSCTYDHIQQTFGIDVANGVLALSKNGELPTKQEQMADSLKRIKAQPQEIWMVKLCDRITNMQPPPQHWKKEKIISYRAEATLILDELGEANEFLAERLFMKVEGYVQYL